MSTACAASRTILQIAIGTPATVLPTKVISAHGVSSILMEMQFTAMTMLEQSSTLVRIDLLRRTDPSKEAVEMVSAESWQCPATYHCTPG
jgi:hypothetical protein